LQNVLRELEQKKPQLDELVHTAENLRADTNRQQLHGKGKCLHFAIYLLLIIIWNSTTLEVKASSKAINILFQYSFRALRMRDCTPIYDHVARLIDNRSCGSVISSVFVID